MVSPHSSALSTMSLSPNIITTQNSLQRRSAIHTSYGKSPVSLSPDDNTIKFDYNIFVTTWQDQIKMRQYDNCEKYCREVIDKLLAAEDQQQLVSSFCGSKSGRPNSARSHKSHKPPPIKSKKSSPYVPSKVSSASTDDPEVDEELHTLLEYRSKVHFSLGYLLKKYFKRYDEARKQYEESIKTG